MPSNIVILIDLNSFPVHKTIKIEQQEVNIPGKLSDPNLSTVTCETSTSIIEKTIARERSQEREDAKENLNEFLLRNAKWVQEFVLTLLSQEATFNNEVDFSDYNWSYSFYNSAKDLPSKYGKRFHPFDLTSFEGFEKHLNEELKNIYAQNKICPAVNKMSCLSSVIKNMIGGDLPWTEPKIQTEDSAQAAKKANRNVLYAMLRVPRSESECLNFVDDVSVLARSQNFVNTLLPRAFFKEFHNRFRIQMNFVDMWYAHENMSNGSWDGTYAAPIAKVLHYLHGGRVLPLTKIEFVPPGLPSYVSLLKLSLKANTNSKSNDNKRMSGLSLKSTSQKSFKISPETEDSFVHSIASGTTARSAVQKCREYSQSSGGRIGTKSFSKQEPVDKYNYGQVNESPRKKKRKRKLIKMDIKREVDSNQESSDDHQQFPSIDLSEGQRQRKFRSFEKQGKPSLDQPSSRSQEELINSSHWTRPNIKKQPLTAPRKMPSSNLPLNVGSVGHAFLAKVKQGNSKTDYVEHILKSDKCPMSVAEKEKSIKREKSLKDIKVQLTSFLKNVTLPKDATEPEVMKALTLKAGIFKDMIIIKDNLSDIELVSLAQGLVNVLTCTIRQYVCITDHKQALEKILIISYETLNVNIMDHKLNSSTHTYAFFKCQLQILLKFELAWMWPGTEQETQEIRDDVLKLLNLISAYRKDPPIQDFVVNTLMDAYAEVQGPLLAAIFRGMAIPLPKKMRMMMSPATHDKNFPDDVSQTSSIDSSLSQLDSVSMAQSNPHSQSYSQNRQSARVKPTLRNASYLSLGNPKRAIMVPLPKLSKSHKLTSDSAKKKLALAVSRSSPKRVRRNLFDVKKHDKEDLKNLITLATTSRFSRSPSLKFRSPCSVKSRSPRSPAYQRGSRSKRRLQMDEGADITPFGLASPDLFSNSGILCPESPATPNSAIYKRTRMSTSFGSTEKNVIQESPEITKIKRGNNPLKRVDSLSFYSTKNSSEKSVAWEKSGAKMMAARIKDSVDLTQSLLLNDIEFLPGSPLVKANRTSKISPDAEQCLTKTSEDERHSSNTSLEDGAQEVSQNGQCYLGLMESPYAESTGSKVEEPCCSKSIQNANSFQFEVSPNNISSNIEALIRSENFPPSSMILNQRNSNKAAACTSMLETPTKKVQFNFNENLINTPSPNRNMSATPKSILK